MKGKKLVIAVILALIVCLVLIPTCAFADNEGDGTQPVGTSTGDGSSDGTGGSNGDNANGNPGDNNGSNAETPTATVVTPAEDESSEPTTEDFATLQEAVNKAEDGDTVVLDKDTTEYVKYTAADQTDKDATIVIDLGGKTLTGVLQGNNEVRAFQVQCGNVTVKNGTIVGRVDVYGDATLTLAKDATIKGYLIVWGSGIDNKQQGNATANVAGEVIFQTVNSNIPTDSAIKTQGSDVGTATINILDGAYVESENDNAVYLPSGNGTLNVYGGTIKGATGIYMKGGNLNILSPAATIIATGEQKDYKQVNAGAEPTGDAVVIEYATSTGYKAIKSVKISEGNFYSENASNIAQYQANETKDPITQKNFISGGWFWYAQPDAELLNSNAALANRNDVIYAVGGQAIYDLAASANPGDVVTITAIPDDEETIDIGTVEGIAGGVVIKNDTDKTIIINGVKLVPDASYTVPGNAPASPLNARYFVISGNNQQWTEGDLEFKLNSKDVVKVLIDGIEVEFTVAEDGTLTIASAVIEKLESGTHEIEFVYADGSCKTVFTVA